ncbi:DMT family transporter [Streptomyces roseolilacinus]|uniref:Membrane protein n=1 Tax=Streptomyces roseolilacinus TaxID=66904 RepID=A0A918AZY9_9ACTN|nr:DMT family transporter [Streptomyces roseolilacinus]GGQ08908.1 membrane protein [Streptomyces roseolilacinus]
MLALSICLALLAAVGNAAASVLQRRAAADTGTAGTAVRGWWPRLVRRRVWVWGSAVLGLSGVFQALALATGPLAVVQPVMSTELLFTLVLGGLVFRRNPDRRTWWAFGAMAAGLAAFLALAEPSGGRATVPAADWLWAGLVIGAVAVGLVAVALRLPSAPRAAVLGTATALGFSGTAALLKDALGRLQDGLGAVFAGWQLYAAAAVGLTSFLLLQVTFRAGTLAASQPALTLGDALLSVVLGVWLFDERVVVGVRGVFEAIALVVLVAACVELARSPLVRGGEEGEDSW